MASREKIKQALLAAHAAGDVESAKKLAAAYKAAGAASAPTAQPRRESAATTLLRGAGESVRDFAAGALRGAGSIGSTLVAPGDMVVPAVSDQP